MKHKHYDLIHAWADGAEIQTKTGKGWMDIDAPIWGEDTEYRIKPEEKEPVVYWLWANKKGLVNDRLLTEEQASWDPELIKLEWSKTEMFHND